MAEIVPPGRSAVNRRLPSAEMARAQGPQPTLKARRTLPVAASISLTVSEAAFATYAVVPRESTAAVPARGETATVNASPSAAVPAPERMTGISGRCLARTALPCRSTWVKPAMCAMAANFRPPPSDARGSAGAPRRAAPDRPRGSPAARSASFPAPPRRGSRAAASAFPPAAPACGARPARRRSPRDRRR